MHNFYLQLVNQQHPWKSFNHSPQLVQATYAEEKIFIDPKVNHQFNQLLEALQLTDRIMIVDGHRTVAEQKHLWNYSLNAHGMNYTKSYVASPGCSEHHTGLAIDIGLRKTEHDLIAPRFEGPEAELFLEHMKDYGFILRYPKNKQKITGIAYEPWHFRYVGTPHSQIIMDHGWTLEEYIEFLKHPIEAVS
ncbi:D,D-carboxypeptidase/D,D-dipeptidase VanXY [Enterococcus mundtii]|uniref:D-alanyl-D-alanine carboxypeptidase-like core domain-containing protein n=1 Tax=Enterococcus mundtii TaxID=53346 RepID=A0A1V2UEQ8_ENTMU|nr:D,D-carboxypeptidase/D,D-dipeptidase VanXY [Enterococcus mundtii]ONN41808.1 hypothetical protein BTN92_11640 [Enterococcus mundtii]